MIAGEPIAFDDNKHLRACIGAMARFKRHEEGVEQRSYGGPFLLECALRTIAAPPRLRARLVARVRQGRVSGRRRARLPRVLRRRREVPARRRVLATCTRCFRTVWTARTGRTHRRGRRDDVPWQVLMGALLAAVFQVVLHGMRGWADR